MAASILRLEESRGVSPGISGMHDKLSLPLPHLASVTPGAYTAVQRDGAELLASPGPDLLSIAREPREPRARRRRRRFYATGSRSLSLPGGETLSSRE